MAKKIVFKSAVFVLTLFTALALTFTSTYSRCITESDHDIGFKAKQQVKISFNGADIDDRTLVSFWQWDNLDWTDGIPQKKGSFNLSLKEDYGVESVDFCIRAFIDKSGVLNSDSESSEQQTMQPPEVSLTLGDNTYNSLMGEADSESYFNANSETAYEGYLYRFCDNLADSEPREHVFHLQPGESHELDFVLNVYNTEILLDKIYICIEIIK